MSETGGGGGGGGEQGGSTMDDITQYMQYLWKNTKDAANCIKIYQNVMQQ